MPDTIPFRKTTRMAITAAVQDFQRNLSEIAKAAIDDAEAPEGYILDVDRGVWRNPNPEPPNES